MVDGDHHHVADAAQATAVVQRIAAAAVVETTAVDVDQDWSPPAVAQAGRGDVEEQAVFAARSIVAGLRCAGTERECIAGAEPWRLPARGLEAMRGGVGA